MREHTGSGFMRNVGYVLGGTLATTVVAAFQGALTGAGLHPLIGASFFNPSVLDTATFAAVIAAGTGIFAGLPAFAMVSSDEKPSPPFRLVLGGIAFHTVIGVAIAAVIGYATATFDRDIASGVYIYGVILGFIVGTYTGAISATRQWRRKTGEIRRGESEGGTITI